MIFNENEIFNSNLKQLQDDCLYIKLNELTNLLTHLKSLLNSSPIPDQEIKLNKSIDSNDNIFINNLDLLNEDIHKNENELDKNNIIHLGKEAFKLLE